MPALVFGYRISRDYPFWWFPWVTVIGGLLFTVLISVFSLATSGYFLDLIYTTDRNATIAEDYWFKKAPFSWADHIAASCQAAELQIGSSLFTDKLWGQFMITDVRVSSGRGFSLPTPTFMYTQNPLENCTVDVMNLYLPSQIFTQGDNATSGQDPPSSYSDPFQLEAFVSCSLNVQRPTAILMTSKFENFASDIYWTQAAFRNGDYGGAMAAAEDAQLASRTLAELSVLLYGVILVAEQELNYHPELTPGKYMFFRNYSENDMNSVNFLSGWKYNYTAASNPRPGLDVGVMGNITLPQSLERILKIFYSSLMVDMGWHESTVFDNIDIFKDWASTAIARSGDLVVGGDEYRATLNLFSNVTQFWIQAAKPIAPLEKSTIYMQYQCQVPRLKTTSALVLSIFLADIVFLRALWWLFNWGTTVWLERNDPHAMYCQGCLAHNKERLMAAAGSGRSNGESYAVVPSETLSIRSKRTSIFSLKSMKG